MAAGSALPSDDSAETFREGIREYRDHFQLGVNFEFKFARTHEFPERRRGFFRVALHQDFRYAVCAIDKADEYWHRASSAEQHWAAATSLAVVMQPNYLHAEQPMKPLRDPVIVDDNRDRNFLEAIRVAFQGLKSKLHPGIPLVQKPRFRRSKSDQALQLADMVCGATGAHLDGDSVWFDM